MSREDVLDSGVAAPELMAILEEDASEFADIVAALEVKDSMDPSWERFVDIPRGSCGCLLSNPTGKFIP